jgi:hypothetical protein
MHSVELATANEDLERRVMSSRVKSSQVDFTLSCAGREATLAARSGAGIQLQIVVAVVASRTTPPPPPPAKCFATKQRRDIKIKMPPMNESTDRRQLVGVTENEYRPRVSASNDA